MPQNQSTHVLFMAAEADPFAKVGGLADVAGSLPLALRNLSGRNSYDVRLVLPYHLPVRKKFPDLPVIARYSVPGPGGEIPVAVHFSEAGGVPAYLIDGWPVQNTAAVYSTDACQDGWKFIFFALACLELPAQLGWKTDIFHANDWHAALSIYALQERKARDPWLARSRSILTIHNLPYMGVGTEEAFQAFNFQPCPDPALPWWARQVPLPLGLLAADRIVAVSPSYAREILTPEFGCGLQAFLQKKATSLSGIINGINTRTWDPAVDPAIHARFSSASLELRPANKQSLADQMGLNPDPAIPLLAMVGRMDQQKGVDLALEGLRLSRSLSWQAVILGTGDPAIEDAARRLELDFPTQVRTVVKFDAVLARQLYAAADLILMPSRYEPCGLPQMIAMRYGCVPLARATGGLLDTICDKPGFPQTGFLFDAPSALACGESIQRALKIYTDRPAWKEIQLSGMAQDFSWEKSAAAYADLYDQLGEAKL